jgi:hypothetical protein
MRSLTLEMDKWAVLPIIVKATNEKWTSLGGVWYITTVVKYWSSIRGWSGEGGGTVFG